MFILMEWLYNRQNTGKMHSTWNWGLVPMWKIWARGEAKWQHVSRLHWSAALRINDSHMRVMCSFGSHWAADFSGAQIPITVPQRANSRKESIHSLTHSHTHRVHLLYSFVQAAEIPIKTLHRKVHHHHHHHCLFGFLLCSSFLLPILLCTGHRLFAYNWVFSKQNRHANPNPPTRPTPRKCAWHQKFCAQLCVSIKRVWGLSSQGSI